MRYAHNRKSVQGTQLSHHPSSSDKFTHRNDSPVKETHLYPIDHYFVVKNLDIYIMIIIHLVYSYINFNIYSAFDKIKSINFSCWIPRGPNTSSSKTTKCKYFYSWKDIWQKRRSWNFDTHRLLLVKTITVPKWNFEWRSTRSEILALPRLITIISVLIDCCIINVTRLVFLWIEDE